VKAAGGIWVPNHNEAPTCTLTPAPVH
jgi:hypothetical protein